MIYFDISSKENALKFLSSFTGINQTDILDFVDDNIIKTDIFTDSTKVNAENFCNRFNLDERNLNVDNILLCAIHYTTNDDENKSIKDYGLRDLQYALSHDTPLRKFLKEHDVGFDIKEKVMFINGKEYNIEYKNYELDDPITHIARKIYFDNQLSCFFNIEDIEEYLGNVHLRPEILYNIDELIGSHELSYEWCRRCKCYEIKFYGKLDDFAKYSFPNDNKTVQTNLIDMSLEVIADCVCGEIFAYLKPSSVISYENIIEITER